MSRRAVFVLIVIAIITLFVWRSQLFTVSRPGEGPRPLEIVAGHERKDVDFDVVLPSIPIGMTRLRSHQGVLLIHYWAPWENDATAQAVGLDSLLQLDDMQGLEAALVCFDPFPSVARFVGRHHLRLPVLLDGERLLSGQLACPSVPFTYVLDQTGRIAIEQAGEIDWQSAATVEALAELLAAKPR